MGLVRQYRHRLPKRSKGRSWQRVLLWSFAGLVGLFLLANVVMAFMYRGQALAGYSVGQVPIGGVSFDELDKHVALDQLLPETVTLNAGERHLELTPDQLGAEIDWEATKKAVKQTRTWVPLFSYVKDHTVPVALKLNEQQSASAREILKTELKKSALPERIVLAGDNFAIAAPESGLDVDESKLAATVLAGLERAREQIELPTVVTNSDAPTGQLGGDLELLQKRLEAKIVLAYGGQNRQLTRNEIGRFYAPVGQTLELSGSQMLSILDAVSKELVQGATNISEAVAASTHALQKAQPVTFALTDGNARVYRYCTAARGVDTTFLGEFGNKLAAVFADPRGWGQAGVALVRADGGCDFTVWLSAPASMPSFGSICDSYYSCRVGPNVVINYDRWMGATGPWNAAGGSLEDYRVMVINHETGHWFGFNHRNCPGAGQPAPVMQQQSISLQGCSFNPWPTASELSAL